MYACRLSLSKGTGPRSAPCLERHQKKAVNGTHEVLWALVADDPDYDRDLVLLTSIPVRTAAEAQGVCTEWRYRPQIEHTYRFDQEDGLDVEDMRVQTLERRRRVFAPVLMAALFVYQLAHVWPHRLRGGLGLTSDLDGPYVLLAGIGADFLAAATLAFAAQHPFPRGGATCL